jgi:uncharacterized membrane protein YfcA
MVVATFLALFIGVSLGLLGGGGSILAVPLLVYVVGLGPRDAVASSLFVVGLASVAAMIPHARAGRVRLRVGLPFGAASMVGAFAGGRLAYFLPEKLLLAGFTGVMVVTALAMMRRRRAETESDATEVASATSLGRASLVGVAIGLLTGVVGAGGGFVIVPALVLLCGLPMRAAVGTSLLVIAMNSFAAFAGAVGHASVPWRIAGFITLAAVGGSLVGATLAKHVPAAVLRKGFAWFVLAMAMLMAWKQLSTYLPERVGVSLLLPGSVAASTVFALLLLRSRRTSSVASTTPRPRS